MNEQTKAQVEAYAEECRTEQLELLRTLGKMPAPTRKEDFRAAFCRDWLRAQGAENVRIDSAKNGSANWGRTLRNWSFLPPTRILCSQM